ncbi:hypothetical protein PILCRDRAFT_3214 [Piloderma croceum F 1598]|uniref:Uncharacterized protein n=1 Tax=Piloderma croceum (strain F 1598) TaxID=765440 RepID=A0A0C3G8W4_PILCF|nr:hypothetical protein PILCRDRAFT_3214 [Piloderma croceum F 1598]
MVDKALLGLRSYSKTMPGPIRNVNTIAKLSSDPVRARYGSIPVTARREIPAYTAGEISAELENTRDLNHGVHVSIGVQTEDNGGIGGPALQAEIQELQKELAEVNEKILWYEEDNRYMRQRAANYRADWINERRRVDAIEMDGWENQGGISQARWSSPSPDRS